ncbi:MAG: glutamine--fructose-6-phosphate transaminase (isomerizing) [Lachnospiraceae bacterium]|nr:glutamine--fructose-6-phosphate transaminase (isomerizing) [Ruminococcus sp.]MCM1275729.1 glutamine--fructose-6-phosphate transaminase (isomerizing) [Lachnospiraceae bacterium]
MCGIVGYIGERDCADVLMDGLEKLEYRGYDSAGIAVFEESAIRTVKTRGKLSCMREKLESEGKPRGFCGIGHTRWATHGEPSDVNSHPHSNGRVTIVHNGIIENYAELKEFLSEKGYKFISQTDSEIVACLLDFYYAERDPLRAIMETVKELKGSYALGILFRDFPDRVYATRKGSPIIVGLGEGEYFLASDIPAFLKYTKSYALLDDDEIVCMESGSISFFDVHGIAVKKETHTADWDVEQAQKQGYPHYMLKEIHEQPEVVKKTLDSIVSGGVPDFSGIGLTDELLRGFGRVFVVACGTAMHAGIVARYAIEKLARVPVTVEIASEFRYMEPIVGEDDLVILVSQSGETADTIAGLELARARGAKTLAVVNVKYSAIARGADMCIHTLAGPEIAVASTKAYSVQIAALYALAFRFAYARGTLDESGLKRLTEQLYRTPEAIAEVIENKDECQFIASQLVNAEKLFFIGRGFDYALSLEGSLKLKEITYIHSEAYAAGELKHGTISLIERNIPVVTVAMQQNVLAKTVSNMEEVKARGAFIIAVCRTGAEFAEGTVDLKLEINAGGLDDVLTPLPTVCALQLIAYYTSVLRGIDPDKPRNLAKSVTTE